MSSRTGRCVVCGRDCTTRCGPCARKGLDWMYFCSTACQEFIWFTHKKFCGKENWEWPPLDKEGRRRVAEIVVEKGVQEIQAKLLWQPENSPPVEGELSFGPLLSQESPYFKSLDSKTRSQLSQCAQATLWGSRGTVDDYSSTTSRTRLDRESVWKGIESDPIGALAHLQLLRRDGRFTEVETPYLRTLQHRLLNLFTVMSLAQREGHSERQQACFEHTFREAKAVLLQAEEPDRAFTRQILGDLLATRSKMKAGGCVLNL